ncbi:MAG: hypothetical protein H6585_14510 [Flavobacteriales bacterium]|nr:hypothetical protein [Flavobacteriales bacterium]MCB9449542.1 hypothetical protein [Flavobacteriales bacterium]
MGCAGCSNGRGTTPAGCGNKGHCATGSCAKLNVYDWLGGIPAPVSNEPPLVEVRFKNSRKEFFRDENMLGLKRGDVVAVEAQSGHDIGIVSLTGPLVKIQMKRKKVAEGQIRKVYRLAKPIDIDKWAKCLELEDTAMLNARKLSKEFNLDMKINDVEYQGDRTKAIFYYSADDRVDFRELIKKLAAEFRVRVEMKQIGIRQEAGRLGGIGSCGRELCCSTWLTDFQTVSTGAARYQQLAINPQKLAGQCGKLKCCLNFELDAYMEAVKEFPRTDVNLETERGIAFHQKTDIFRRLMWFSYRDEPNQFYCVPLARVKEIIAMNKEQKKPEALLDKAHIEATLPKEPTFADVLGEESLTRFDNKKKRKKGKKGGGDRHRQGRGRSRSRNKNQKKT